VSFRLLMTLTVIEIVLLVVVLAIFLILLTRRLQSIAVSLARVSWGVRAVETHVAAVAPGVTRVNELLQELTEDLLPGVAAKADELASR
jgi:uncharacterized protein YoxC